MKGLGMLLLAIWLIVVGVVAVFSVTFSGMGTLIGILEIAAGALLLYENRTSLMGIGNLGMSLLSVWLVIDGLRGLIPSLNFSGLGTILALLALVAGGLIAWQAFQRGAARNMGMLLLGVFVFLVGLFSILSVGSAALFTVTYIIAIAAGVLLLMRR